MVSWGDLFCQGGTHWMNWWALTTARSLGWMGGADMNDDFRVPTFATSPLLVSVLVSRRH